MTTAFDKRPEPAPEPLVSVAAPAPVADPEAVYRANVRGARLIWAPHTASEDGWHFGGIGAAGTLERAGGEPLDALGRRGSDALRTIATWDGCDVPAPRWFGGLAFGPDAADAEPWRAFGAGSFTLPRWLYGVRAGSAFLRLTAPPGELASGAPEDELRAILAALGTRAGEAHGSATAHVEETGLAAWESMVKGALEAFGRPDNDAGHLDKVVLATETRVRSAGEIGVAGTLGRLASGYPTCTRFAFARDDVTFLGATPERLVTLRDGHVRTAALAGSIAPGDVDEGAPRERLLASDKDRREHDLVIRGIRDALGPYCARIDVAPEPRVQRLRNVLHLRTSVEARLARPTHVLALVDALHPTPAVGGLPKRAAHAWIERHEPFRRGWYAGPIGWFDAAGDGAFAVALRCGVVRGDRAWLYAGSGIVPGSDARAEHDEARLKRAAVLGALGFAP